VLRLEVVLKLGSVPQLEFVLEVEPMSGYEVG
jgi:hypothetical protein